MRSYRVPLFLLALMLSACLINSVWLSRRCAGWTEALDAIDRYTLTDNWEAAERQLENLYLDWLEVQTWLHITIEHEELDKAEALFCRSMVLVEEKDSVEFRAHIADLHSQLHLLCELEQLSIANVL